MKIASSAQLPPLATDTFMRCDLKTEAFVPTRILMEGIMKIGLQVNDITGGLRTH